MFTDVLLLTLLTGNSETHVVNYKLIKVAFTVQYFHFVFFYQNSLLLLNKINVDGKHDSSFDTCAS